MTGTAGAGGGSRLTERALNRATLARQHLLAPSGLTALDMIEHLVGMQAQAPYPPYVGLWTRLRTFRHEDLARLLEDRSVTRILLQRGTVHLVSAADCLALRPVVQRVIDRMYVTAKATAAAGDPEVIARHAEELLATQGPLTPKELGDALAERLPGGPPRVLADVARARLALVQLPPRAVWGVGGVTRYDTAESWLGAPLRAADMPTVIRRYLAAFGPATVADVQTWCGLTRLREVTDGMTGLRRLRGANGAELLDVPDAPLPDPDTPAPPRFLPDFDNVVLSHADRTRIVPEQHRKRLVTRNGIVPATILVDGMVAGTWRADDGLLTITPFAPLPPTTETQLHDTGLRLARFLTPPNTDVKVRFDNPTD
ncbi:winged helix DNA-binding domain-containing protein [Streptomyces sp. NPDC053542]|uniref:winged helix DNA-binding domain-containing protein n=1 Tax=Streptomyces sp. NPDC053542 TaxID=3365710 RepID=UPI0037D5F0EF